MEPAACTREADSARDGTRRDSTAPILSQRAPGEHEQVSGEVPLNWKLANVLGFKKGKKDDPDNYRSVMFCWRAVPRERSMAS